MTTHAAPSVDTASLEYYTLERGAFERAEAALAALEPRTRRLAVRAADVCSD